MTHSPFADAFDSGARFRDDGGVSDGSKVEMTREGERRRYTWGGASPGARAIIRVMTGVRPLERA